MAEVVLKNIKKAYDDVIAVHDFNLEIRDKEFIVLVGPSGCGKSTTLRMVAGLEEITDGELYIDGKLMNSVAPKDRDIAMVFQNYALYPHMTVYENMAYSLKVKKASKEVIDRSVREAAEVLDITPLLERKPKELSGGQKQRVAIGRAFVRDPKVFLMDEPLSNLDAKLRNQMRAEIIKLRSKIDTTFIYVTHDQTEAMTLGDRIVIMKDGYIQQIGTPQEVFTKPKNIFVAGFIGVPQMNFFGDCRLTSSDGRYQIEILGKKYDLTDAQNELLASRGVNDRAVTAGLRPLDLQVAETDEDDADAVIEVAEMMGSEMHLHMKAADESITSEIISIVNTSEVELDDYAVGRGVKFTFKPRALHLFDTETEENLLF